MNDGDLLDAYSRSVISVAETVLPSVASLSVRTARGGGSGSASVITDDGFLLTSAHVVAGAERASASFADGTDVVADVIGRDPLSDLAVLRARGPVPPPVEFGDASALRVGQLVVALGNPLGLAGSFSAGVISGLGRTINPSGAAAPLTNLIQFDAAVNPGSSAGPLLDRNGRVVGIVTALANPTADNFFIGIGFAVPIDTPTAGGTRGPNR